MSRDLVGWVWIGLPKDTSIVVLKMSFPKEPKLLLNCFQFTTRIRGFRVRQLLPLQLNFYNQFYYNK